jgi:hypothetical protein
VIRLVGLSVVLQTRPLSLYIDVGVWTIVKLSKIVQPEAAIFKILALPN